MQTVVTETYISCRAQQINGRVYAAGEAIEGADALPTLPALLRTSRVRLATVVTHTPEEDAVELGSAEPSTPSPSRKRKTSRRAARG